MHVNVHETDIPERKLSRKNWVGYIKTKGTVAVKMVVYTDNPDQFVKDATYFLKLRGYQTKTQGSETR